MISKYAKIALFTGLSILGTVVVILGFLMTPVFVAAHFSATGVLPETTIQSIQIFRMMAVCGGIILVVLGTSLAYSAVAEKSLNYISRFSTILEKKPVFWVFCGVCFVFAVVVGLLMTKTGISFSPDSVNYMVAGENLYHHHIFGIGPYGLFTHNPGYPIMIAGMMVFGLDGEQASRLIQILSFAAMIFPMFFLAKKISGIAAGYIVGLMGIVFQPLIWLSTWAWTDMPFILFSMVGVLFLTYYAESSEPKKRELILAGVFVAIAILVRFVGICLLIVGFLAILAKNFGGVKAWNKGSWFGIAIKKHFKGRSTIIHILLFEGIAFFPVFLYLCRCFVYTGRFSELGWSGKPIFGFSTLIHWLTVDPVRNLTTDSFFNGLYNGLKSIFYMQPVLALFVVLIVAAIVISFLVNYFSKYFKVKEVLGWISSNYIVILFFLGYFSMIFLNGVIYSMWTQANYLSPFYPPIILAVVSFAIWGYRQMKGSLLRPALFSLIAVTFALFMILQINSSVTYYRTWKQNPFGQGINSAVWKNEQGMTWALSNIPEDAKIYANDVPGAWFVLDRPIIGLPHFDWPTYIQAFIDEQLTNPDDNTYIVDFKETDTWKPVWRMLSNSDIEKLNEQYHIFVVVADFPTSTIWQVKP